MASCATVSCEEATACGLEGGCTRQRFGQRTPLVPPSDLRDDARALNGTKPRAVRDPRFMKRKRKAITK
jgi:hypothetical protein